MKKLKEIFVINHPHPESEEAQAEIKKYEKRGYAVYCFGSVSPRSFQGTSLAYRVSELFRLESFVHHATNLNFSDQCLLHAKIELDQLRAELSDLIPRKPFANLPISTKWTWSLGIRNFVQPKSNTNDKQQKG